MENAEINNIIKILGLQYKKNYSDPDSLKSLRYGKIMIMTDQVCCAGCFTWLLTESNFYSSFNLLFIAVIDHLINTAF